VTPPHLDAAFLDRDGTINVKQPEGRYVTSPAELELLPGAGDAIRLLNEHGVPVIVVTNQRGIARGVMTESALSDVHDRMRMELAAHGARVDAIYHCPHEIGACSCRKPEVGLFLQARRDFPAISFERSAVVGDSPSDIEAGRRLGATTVLIEPEPRASEERRDTGSDHVVASLLEAVKWLLGGARVPP
jgi:D-glycero-D-manno-heptose 1,7-bisphosphate phosphatase